MMCSPTRNIREEKQFLFLPLPSVVPMRSLVHLGTAHPFDELNGSLGVELWSGAGGPRGRGGQRRGGRRFCIDGDM